MIRLCLLLILVFPVIAASADQGWKAGAASAVITPEEPLWMAGYGSRSAPASGKETELHAKALVIEDAEGKRGMVLTLDLVGIDREFSARVASALMERHQLPREAVAICTSHTHSGPVVAGNLAPMHYESLPPEEQARIDAYAESLLGKILAVSEEAFGRLSPAKLQWGSGKCTFAVNRRENKETEVPEKRAKGDLSGPSDHDVPVLSVRSPEGELKAVLFGYACHATVLSGQSWNADYPGYAQTELEAKYPGIVALFWAGCGGDQNPVPRREVPLAEAYGADLAARVGDVLRAHMPELSPSLSLAYREIKAPLDPLPTSEELKVVTASSNRFEAARAKYLLKRMEKRGGLEGAYPYPVLVWSLGGEVEFIALGGEVVVDYALRLKRERNGTRTWVAGYSNDVMAYIPSLRVLKEGGYEGGGSNVYYGLPALWHETIEEVIVKAVHETAGARP
ncbi:MAG: neutral/alkaline non-lysosomal ceramidase N-terminal domain-containing protein [Verrucomicrobiae bacterium]|nr:neutral/alkaline non-lysosomal ceramidase N-terminal domain-containing protein [Verrucomicrobiae bacterium]